MFRVALLGGVLAGALRAETLEFQVVDASGRPLPCRIHLADASGAPQRADGLPFWHDHFVCPGHAELTLKPGRYDYQIERGPEHRPAVGSVTLSDNQSSMLSVTLQRIADMAARGWWSGELHVHRAVEEMPLHLRAEDLHVAPVITWWNSRNLWRERDVPPATLKEVDNNRYFDVMAGEDERDGGALLFFGLRSPLPLPGSREDFPEHPSPLSLVALARQHDGVWIDIEKPFWWDMPTWVASGQIDSIGLANNHMCRDRMYEDEAWGRPRDRDRLPSPRGNGFWTQEIYYHLLNCGLRVPPSAGSASGVLPNPVGYNRAYVDVGQVFSYAAWWEGLKAGRSFVTNGPLLVCRANGHSPGHLFQSDRALEIELSVDMISNDAVPQLEIIQDGRIERVIALERRNEATVSAQLVFRESGWFLVRAIADSDKTFRFASTAPYYVEIGTTTQRISRRSTQFFLDWVDERRSRVRQNLNDPAKLNEVLSYHDAAHQYWQQLANQANAD